MKVKIELDKLIAELGNHGITLKISDNSGAHQGDLRIGRAKVEWMKGRTRSGNGFSVPLERVLELIEQEPTRKLHVLNTGDVRDKKRRTPRTVLSGLRA